MLQAFISSFGDGATAPDAAVVDSEADSRRIQEFLKATEGAFRGHPAWRGASEEELEAGPDAAGLANSTHKPSQLGQLGWLGWLWWL